jgi:hypothetical protein
MLRRFQPIIAVLVLLSGVARAGGPAYVAGASYFDPTTKGTPIVGPRARPSYYTDHGDLSAILPGPNADTFVAAAFGSWTSIPTVAVSATRGGQLARTSVV